MEISLKFQHHSHFHGCGLHARNNTTMHAAICFPFSYPRPNLVMRLRSESPPHSYSTNHDTVSVERNSLLHKHNNKVKGSSPLKLLEEDGDLTEDQFWAVVNLLKHDSRAHQILQAFNLWKNTKPSRSSENNYNTIIDLLCEEGCMEEAVSALGQMKNISVEPSLETYTSIVHGFSNRGNFDSALFFLNQMKESGLRPDSYTYDGLIRAYGKFGKYDEMGSCLKEMDPPDHVTYNLLIREFSRGALFHHMENTARTMLSKRMYLQPSSLVSILEAYTKFGIVDKMQKAYERIMNSRIPIEEDLIRRMALVYMENRMFSRLDDLGQDHCSKDLGWCLRLLSHACLLSKNGIESVMGEMEEQRVPLSVTFANIVLLSCLKTRDFKYLRVLLSEVGHCKSFRPDIVTVGVVLDANRVGFSAFGTLELWRRLGILHRDVEMDTDPLVLAAFGKGQFLRSCEEVYSGLEPVIREKKKWTYSTLIELVKPQKIDSD